MFVTQLKLDAVGISNAFGLENSKIFVNLNFSPGKNVHGEVCKVCELSPRYF